MGQSSILERLSALDTNTVSDALNLFGLDGATYGLLPLWTCPKIVGRVSTATFSTNPDISPKVHQSNSVLDEVTEDDRILVISGSIYNVSCWENLIHDAWKSNRIRGAIIDGMYGDDNNARQAGCPVYGRGLAGEHHQEAEFSSGIPIQIRGSVVHQDDYAMADRSGTVFISTEHIKKVLEAAERINHSRTFMAQVSQDNHLVSDTTSKQQSDGVQVPNKGTAEDQELVELFAASDTPAVSDALDKLGIHGQALNIMPLISYKEVTVGPAFTIRYVPASDPPKGVGDYIDDVAEGDVIVIDNGGRTDCTVWGDILTQYAGIRGIAGTVIDGVCRDVNRAIDDDYPIFSAGRWMRTGKDRIEVGGVNEPIGIGRVHVNPRDIVVADANGVVIVPRHRAREVAEIAMGIIKSEEQIREMISSGATIGKARQELNYHKLQRKV